MDRFNGMVAMIKEVTIRYTNMYSRSRLRSMRSIADMSSQDRQHRHCDPENGRNLR